MTSYQNFIGIDIAKETMSVSPDSQHPFTVQQNAAGWENCLKQLAQYGCDPSRTLVVMEATGPYSLKPARMLYEAGYQVSLVNPLQSHYFARTLLYNSKTDQRDAQMLAAFGRQFEPRSWQPAPPIREAIYQCLLQRDRLIRVRVQIKNQLGALRSGSEDSGSAAMRYEPLLDAIKVQIKAVDKELKVLLEMDSPYRENARLLLSIKGFGIVTVGWLLVLTHNFAFTRSGKHLASFCGLVPHARESGTSIKGKKRVRFAGNERLRSALYAATVSAGKHNPAIKVFYERLRERGKPVKVARIAAARKLVHMAWGVIRWGQPFESGLAAA